MGISKNSKSTRHCEKRAFAIDEAISLLTHHFFLRRLLPLRFTLGRNDGIVFRAALKCLLGILFTLCVFTEAFAQISIDSTDFPIGGIQLSRTGGYTVPPFTPPGSPGLAGTDQFYDFTTPLIGAWNDTVKYLAAAQTLFTSIHPGATVAQVNRMGPIPYTLCYYTADANAYWLSGITAIGDFGNGLDTVSVNHLPNNVDTIISIEYYYGNSDTEYAYYKVTLTPSEDFSSRTIRYIDVDGWGSLQTPLNTWDTVLRVKNTEFRYDTVFAFAIPVFDTIAIRYYYSYYAKNVRHPVVVADSIIGGIWKYQYLYLPPVIYGCTDSMAINYNPLANKNDGNCIYCSAVSYTITPDTSICEGDSIFLTITGGATHLWSTGDTTTTIWVSPDTTAVYSVYVSDTPICWNLATVEVVVHKPVNTSFWTEESSYGMWDSVLFINSSSEATDYYWEFDDIADSTSTNESPKHAYATSGTKSIMLVAYNACYTDTFFRQLTITPSTGVDEMMADDKIMFHVYPNPGTTTASIVIAVQSEAKRKQSPENIQIAVYDILGKKQEVASPDFIGLAMTGNKWRFEIQNGNLPAGIYIIQLSIGERKYQQKWVKIH